MRSSFNRIIRRTAAGISALCILAGSYNVTGDSFTYRSIPVNAAGDAEDTFMNGDFNCDGKVNIKDLSDLTKYLKDSSSIAVTNQGLANIRAAYYYNSDSYYPDYDDAKALIEYFAGANELGTKSFASPDQKTKPGDVDCDGCVDLKDLKALNNYIRNKEAYPITDQGRINARASYYYNSDSYYPDKDDIQALLEYLAGVNELGCKSFKTNAYEIIPGDVDCDGDVDFDDIDLLNRQLKNYQTYSLTDQGRVNARAAYYYSADPYYPDKNDTQALLEYLAGVNDLGCKSFKTSVYETIPGDVDCDGDVDTDDAVKLDLYLKDKNAYPVTEQGRVNARAAYYYAADSYYPDHNDVSAIVEYLAGINELGCKSLKTEYSDIILDAPKDTVYGDFNCDGIVDIEDSAGIGNYITDPKGKKISLQALKNGDVCNPGSGLDADDIQTIVDHISGKKLLPYCTTDYLKNRNLPGDFNCDNKVNTSDTVMLNSYLNDKTTYTPSAQGIKNANVFRKDSSALDFNDVAAITEYIAGMTDLPIEDLVTIRAEHLCGDFNCDNKVNITDAVMLNTYLMDKSSYSPSAQGLENADVYKPGSGVNFEDVCAIAEFIAGAYELPTDSLLPEADKYRYGDFNCDNEFNVTDAWMLYRYIEALSDYSPSEQGRNNADVCRELKVLDYNDLERLLGSLKTGKEIPADKEDTAVTTTAAATKPAATTTTKAVTTKPATTTTKAVTTKAATTTTKAATTKPVTTTTKAATTKPATTTTKAVTTKPATTTTKAVTTKPATTATKAVSTKPATTSTKAVTTKPATTSTKAVTTKPATTATKAVTTKPATTATKAVSTKPATTATKAVSTKPATTATKAVSTKPVTTEPATAPVSTTPAYTPGDITRDGVVDSSDASAVLLIYARASTGLDTVTAEMLLIGDVNRDGAVDSSDASLILDYYAHISTDGKESPEEYFSKFSK